MLKIFTMLIFLFVSKIPTRIFHEKESYYSMKYFNYDVAGYPVRKIDNSIQFLPFGYHTRCLDYLAFGYSVGHSSAHSVVTSVVPLFKWFCLVVRSLKCHTARRFRAILHSCESAINCIICFYISTSFPGETESYGGAMGWALWVWPVHLFFLSASPLPLLVLPCSHVHQVIYSLSYVPVT